jgi:hypothetical protein
MKNPYLSIVLASRNDDYAGGMLRRLQVFISSLLEQADRHKLASELILVDWNPPPHRALLKEAILWPKHTNFCTVRAIEVPPSVHQRFKFSDKLPILIHRARNVGVRRARGEFILPTSSDILFSDVLMQFFAAKLLKIDRMYRIARYDVCEDVLKLPSLNDRLAYCERNIVSILGQEFSYVVKGLNGHPVLYTNASGDFILLSREFYFKLHGIPEETKFHSAHFDSVLCYMAYFAGAQEEVLQDPMRIYHIDHETSSWKPRPSWLENLCWRFCFPRRLAPQLASLVRRIAPPKSRIEAMGIPVIELTTEYESLIRDMMNGVRPVAYNDDTWGLPQDNLPESVIISAKWETSEAVQ